MTTQTVPAQRVRELLGDSEPARWVCVYKRPEGEVWSIPNSLWRQHERLCRAWWEDVRARAQAAGLQTRYTWANDLGQGGFLFFERSRVVGPDPAPRASRPTHAPSSAPSQRGYRRRASGFESCSLRELLGWEGAGDFDLYADTQFPDRD